MDNDFKKRIMERINGLVQGFQESEKHSMTVNEVNKSYDELRINLLIKENERLKELNSNLSTQNSDLYMQIYKLQEQLEKENNINFQFNFFNNIKKETKILFKKIFDWFNT